MVQNDQRRLVQDVQERSERLIAFAEAYGQSLNDVTVTGSLATPAGEVVSRVEAQPVRSQNSAGRGGSAGALDYSHFKKGLEAALARGDPGKP